MQSKNSYERSLSTLVDESISENARLLFKRFQSPIQTDPKPPQIDEINVDNAEGEIGPVGSSVGEGLRLRPVGGASNQVDGAAENEEDKILNINQQKEGKNKPEIDVVKDREMILNNYAAYKAEKEVC